ncbi:MAG: polyphosphate kinase 2 family protein [Planctomycetes bacterium]|nr:polyphosphate kinase 2 family protein [Planctomycetota bacterium]
MHNHRFNAKKFFVEPESKLKLAKISSASGDELSDKKQGVAALEADIESLQEAQERLYASNRRALLVILQGMDTAGKDGIIRHVLRGVSPMGCRVHSFRAPNTEELEHHFLWRPMRFLPPKGVMAIFNRSYYEEVLVVRVHPKFLGPQNLLPYKNLDDLWQRRYREMRSFEKTLVDSGTSVLKFYLHISRNEQRKRLLERLQDPSKHWKFNPGDLEERKLWPQYIEAFEDALSHTSIPEAPWYVIPADDKWYARAAVADIIAAHLESLDLEFPEVSKEVSTQFENYSKALRDEKD